MKKGTMRRNIKEIFKVCFEFKGYMFLMGIMLLLNSLLSTYPIKYIQKIIDICTETDVDLKLFFITGGVYLTLQILNIVARGGFEYIVSFMETKIGHKIRMMIFHKLQRLTFGFFDKSSSGDLMTRLVQDSSITIEGVLKPFIFIIRDTMMFILGVYFMGSIDLGITMIMIPIGLVISFVAVKTGPKIHGYAKSERNANSQLWNKFTEGIRGIREVKAGAQEVKFSSDVAVRSKEANRKVLKLRGYMILTSNINSSFFMGIIAFIMIFGGYKVSLGTLSVGGLSAIMMYNGLLIDPMTNFFSLYQEMQRINVSMEKILYILHEKEEPGDYKYHEFKCHSGISIKDVDFTYGSRKVLHGVSMDIRKGDKVAFVGHSGSGKSTLSKLLMRFYDYEHGEVLVDGRSLKDTNIESIRNSIGIVFQDTFLFSCTMRENLTFFNPKASDEEIQRVIEVSRLGDVIENLENGLDTVLGENGAMLSGGERQRVAIGRTLLRNPEILILDESTSALDPVTSAAIMEGLLREYSDRTIIFVAHKLTSVSGVCNKLFVFEKGQIVEEGTHELLMKEDGLYKEIYDSQFVER